MFKMIERDFFVSQIKLGDPTLPAESKPVVQVLRIGRFNHPKYGEFEITAAKLAEMKKNFDDNVRGVDIAVDYFHKSDEQAAGWFTELYLLDDGNSLWAKVDWTKAATAKLSDREVRYFSPDFAFEWTNEETGQTFNNVLFGGGLTNRPFVKEMAAIVASEQGGKMTEAEFKALQAQVKKLAEDGAAVADLPAKHAALQAAHADLQTKHNALKKQLDDADADPASETDPADDSDDPAVLKKQLADMKAKNAEMAENAKKSAAAQQLAEKEAKFVVMLSEGKACVAQKEAFIKGDVEAFAKLAEKVNLDPNGSAGNGGDKTGDREDRVIKLAEEKIKADPKLDRIQALTLANKEIK